MPKSSFSWLHLTDFHYGLKGQDCLWPTLREPFLESLGALHEKCGPWAAVLFTGDLVQSGESAQFEKMQAEVLDPLWEKLRELGSGNAVLLAVPGNHDLYRPNPFEDNPAVDVLLEDGGFQRIKEKKFWDQPAGGYRRVINDAFAAYSQWWEKAPNRAGNMKAGALPGDFSATLEFDGRRIGIVGLNTTFLQLAGGNYEGRLPSVRPPARNGDHLHPPRRLSPCDPSLPSFLRFRHGEVRRASGDPACAWLHGGTHRVRRDGSPPAALASNRDR